MVNPKTVKDRRMLRFASLDEALTEATRLAAAEEQGRLKQLGNWSLGVSLHHIAVWARYPFDGYAPEVASPPWFVKCIARLFKKRFMTKPMPAGMRIPGIEAGTMGTEPTPTPKALAEMRAAFERLDREAPTRPNPAMGPLNHEEWKSMNLRHAEHHLGFYREA